MKLKVMAYNIFFGFHKIGGFENGHMLLQLEPERVKAVVKTVLKEDPDILFLTEAWYQDLVDYRKIFPQFKAAFGDGKHFLFSKYPLTARKIFMEKRVPDKAYTSAKINLGKKKVHFIGVHPSHSGMHHTNEKVRTDIFRKIFKKVVKSKKNLIMAGDFNSLSPRDKYNAKALIDGNLKWSMKHDEYLGLSEEEEENMTKPQLRKHMRKYWKKHIDEYLTAGVIKYVESEGLIDAHKNLPRAQRYTNPTKMDRIDDGQKWRIDYIFITPDIKVKSAKIPKNKLTEIASDHYPIIAEFEI
tara:strand:- start:1077 stop:1973 length:897 start_codon:yes stop_codon:yes gene_type:complete